MHPDGSEAPWLFKNQVGCHVLSFAGAASILVLKRVAGSFGGGWGDRQVEPQGFICRILAFFPPASCPSSSHTLQMAGHLSEVIGK